MSGILYIISAPSGSGKTTLVNELRRQYVPHLEFSISYTTRPPRGSELDSREYHFISREEFEEMIRRDEFLEYAQVFGKYYGTAKSMLKQAADSGNDLLLDIDVQGERQVKAKMPDAVSIFVLPPSRTELESRLRKRSVSENMHEEEVIRRRLDTARREIERLSRSSQTPSPEEKKYLDAAEKCLKARMEDKIKGILASFDEPSR